MRGIFEEETKLTMVNSLGKVGQSKLGQTQLASLPIRIASNQSSVILSLSKLSRARLEIPSSPNRLSTMATWLRKPYSIRRSFSRILMDDRAWRHCFSTFLFCAFVIFSLNFSYRFFYFSRYFSSLSAFGPDFSFGLAFGSADSLSLANVFVSLGTLQASKGCRVSIETWARFMLS